MGQARRQVVWALVGSVLALAVAFLPLFGASLAGTPASPSPDPSSSHTFSFTAAGDFGPPGSTDLSALMKRTGSSNAAFLLALGDLSYANDEQVWCEFIKAQFNDVLIIAGNHDTGESSGGQIADYVRYCPYTLSVPLTAGPGTLGYGYEYYFDYPATTPLVRFIMTTPGVRGSLNFDYSAGSSHFNWVVNAVNDARTRGIPWIVAGMHKQCVVAGDKSSCEMGQAVFDKLVELKVDFILQAHAHNYERSKQLALGAGCTTVPAAGNFDPDCVVDDGSDDFYQKGAGSLSIISGTGGRSIRSVTLSASSDAEANYFVEMMGNNANTQSKAWGYGITRFEVGAASTVVETDFCPPGTTDGSGQCLTQQTTVFKDRFQVGGTPPPLGIDFAYTPTSPVVGDTVSFQSFVTGGTAPFGFAWTFGDGGTASVANPTHAFGSAGTFTVTEVITDALSATATSSKGITVAVPPPLIDLPTNAFRGRYFDNEDLTNQRLQRVDANVNFNWGTGAPDPVVGPETFSVRWEGLWDFAQDAVYRFTMTTDDGMRVSIDNTTTVLEAFVPQAATTYTSDVELRAGRHYVKIEFFDRTNQAIAQASWAYFAPPSDPRPTARIGRSPSYPRPGDTITFDASTSTSLNGTLNARWDWEDDGVWDTSWSTSLSATHAFAAEGSYTVRLEVRDAAGWTDNETQSVAVDGSPPTTTAAFAGTSGASGWYRSAVAVTLTGSDPLSGVASTQVRVDAGSWQAYASPVSVSGDGTHTIEFTSTDRAGNVEPVTSANLQIDATPPATSHSLAGTLVNGSWYTSDVTVTLTAADATSGVASTRARIDLGSWVAYTGPFAVTGNGTHNVEYGSSDQAGNAEGTRSVAVQIGETLGPPPVSTASVSGTSGSGGWYVSAVEVSLQATDPVGLPTTIQVRVDAGTWQSYAVPFTLGQGRHTVEHYSTNSAGSQETVRAFEVKVDVSPPTVTATSSGVAGPTGWFREPVVVVLVAGDALSGVASLEYRIDAGPWTLYASSVIVGEGRHLLEYRATDAAGLTSSAGVVPLDVDLTAPTLTALSPGGVVSTSRVLVSWIGRDSGSGIAGFEVSVDGGGFATLGAVTGIALDLTDGAHNVVVRATDAAGNEAIDVASFRVDTNAFSLTGPYSGIPTFLIIELGAAATVAALMRRRHKRRMSLYD